MRTFWQIEFLPPSGTVVWQKLLEDFNSLEKANESIYRLLQLKSSCIFRIIKVTEEITFQVVS